jgi:hypothetical protein
MIGSAPNERPMRLMYRAQIAVLRWRGEHPSLMAISRRRPCDGFGWDQVCLVWRFHGRVTDDEMKVRAQRGCVERTGVGPGRVVVTRWKSASWQWQWQWRGAVESALLAVAMIATIVATSIITKR